MSRHFWSLIQPSYTAHSAAFTETARRTGLVTAVIGYTATAPARNVGLLVPLSH